MRSALLLAAALLTFSTVAVAQESPVSREGCRLIDIDKPQKETTWESPEFGSLDEIKNCTKVYVWASDFDDRKRILKALEKEKTLTVVGSVKESEFAIAFQVGGMNTGASIAGGVVTNNRTEVGQLLVFSRGSVDENGKRHQRIVWSDTETRDFSGGITFSRTPLSNSLNQFLKDLRKAREK